MPYHRKKSEHYIVQFIHHLHHLYDTTLLTEGAILVEKVARIRLIEERKHKGWTQQQVADLLGTTQNNVSRWELGITTPNSYFRTQLCELFGKSSQYLGLLPAESTPLTPSQPKEERPTTQDLSLHWVVVNGTATENPRLWGVPYRRNPFFTGREETLQHMHDYFFLAKEGNHPFPLALCGLGGVGKTQTALEYAYHFCDRYQAVLWLNVETPETLITDAIRLTHLFGLPQQDQREPRRAIGAVKEWLNTHAQWLVILDNVEDFAIVDEILPQSGTGHILLTTQEQALGPIAQYISLDKMTGEEGALFLLRRAKLLALDAPLATVTASSIHYAQELAQLMDGLPLALDQAGAYIEETKCRLSDYLNRYKTQDQSLLNRRGRAGGTHPHTVTKTFAFAFEQIEHEHPAAADLLRLCAFLYPDTIPEELFTQESLDFLAQSPSLTLNSLLFDEALATLRRYSLLHRDPETQTLTIHRLVQSVLKARMDQATYRQWARHAVRVVNRAFPDVKELTTWTDCQRLLSQALLCMTYIEQEALLSEDAGRLLHQTGAYLLECAQYEQARLYIQRAHDIRVQLFGATHPSVAESLNHLAELLYYQGSYAQAEQLHLQTLTIRQQYLEADHLDIATSLNNLAGLYWIQGRYREAEPLYQQALQIREKALGGQHLDVAETLQNLAYLYYNQEKYQQAEPLYQRALAISQQILGEDHAYLTTLFNNLGQLYQALNQYDQAESLYHKALAICAKRFSPEHPRLAMSLSNLASLYCAKGDYERAELLYQQAIAIRQKVLGTTHPRTVQTCYDLARLYSAQGNFALAHQFFQTTLTIRVQTLGPDHLEVAQTLAAWTACYLAEGVPVQAETLLERVQTREMR